MTYDIYFYILLKTVACLNFHVHVLHAFEKVKRAKISKKQIKSHESSCFTSSISFSKIYPWNRKSSSNCSVITKYMDVGRYENLPEQVHSSSRPLEGEGYVSILAKICPCPPPFMTKKCIFEQKVAHIHKQKKLYIVQTNTAI